MGKVYTPITTFFVDYEGSSVTLVANVTRVREGHPLFEGNREHFKEVNDKVDFEVEKVAARVARPKGR